MSKEAQQHVEQFVGHRVRLTLTNRSTAEGVLEGFGAFGLTLLSGIGGYRRFQFGDVDAIEDLGPAVP